MTKLMARLPRTHDDDRGVGVITVVLMAAVITSLLITSVLVVVNNLGNTRRDRQALAALASSEAGVAQAVQFLRGGSIGALTCIEPAAGVTPGSTCQGAGPSWTSATNPMKVSLSGGSSGCTTSNDCFQVWIGTVQKYVPNCAGRHASPPSPCVGTYRVHSTGRSEGGTGARRVAVDVTVRPYPFPIGIFAEKFSGNGNVGIHRQSLFTNGCMMNRQDDSTNGSGLQFSYDSIANRPMLDLIYDQPVSAHATGAISTSNNSCGSGSGGAPIHDSGACNPTFKWDQDAGGGPLAVGGACYGKYIRADGSVYPTTSKFDASELKKYDYRPRGLTDAQYDALRSQAQAQGTYNLPPASISSTLTSLVTAGTTSPVLYWDTGDISLRQTNFPASVQRALSDVETCANPNVTIVVAGPGHDLDYRGGNSAPWLVASIFVPDGTITGQGGRNTIGTVFAKEIDLGGNIDFYMDKCFTNNPPGATLDVTVTDWREDDSRDI